MRFEMPGMRERMETGYVYEAGDRWYVRYRRTEIKDGKAQLVQVSEFLCDKDKVYYSADYRAVRLLRDEFMLKVNQRRLTADMSVAQFRESVDLPFAEKTRRASALNPCKQIWN